MEKSKQVLFYETLKHFIMENYYNNQRKNQQSSHTKQYCLEQFQKENYVYKTLLGVIFDSGLMNDFTDFRKTAEAQQYMNNVDFQIRQYEM